MKGYNLFLLAVTMLASMGSSVYGEGPGSPRRITGLSGPGISGKRA